MNAVAGSASAPAEELSAGAKIECFAGDADTEAVLRGILARSNAGTYAIHRGGAEAAIAFCREHPSPRALLVDVSSSSLPMNDMDELANVCEPDVGVIVIGADNSVGLFRDLLRLGVTDYIAKPVPQDLLHRALNIALGRDSAATVGQRVGKLVSVIGAAGGAGATTVAGNVGWLLANRFSRRAALIDLDLQSGALGLMLDIKPNHGLREALENAQRVDQLFLERIMIQKDRRLFALTSEEPLEEDIPVSLEHVERLLDVLKRQFHYVCLDVPRAQHALAVRIMQISDIRIMVADPTVGSVRDIVRRLRLLGNEES
ncbi:MAG: AAA family ATPase, partial [Pirellulales bacterium]|nr:AAA family ATPase [Pirellulales bacterium]